MPMPAHAKEQVSEEEQLRAEIAEVVLHPDLWLETPNDQFGGKAPRELLRTEEGREALHALIQAVRHGMTT